MDYLMFAVLGFAIGLIFVMVLTGIVERKVNVAVDQWMKENDNL